MVSSDKNLFCFGTSWRFLPLVRRIKITIISMVEMAESSRTLGVQEERDLKKFLKFLSLKVS